MLYGIAVRQWENDRDVLYSETFTVDILTLPIRTIMLIPCFILSENSDHPFSK